MKEISTDASVLITDVDINSTKVVCEIIREFFPMLRIGKANVNTEALAFLESNTCQIVVAGFSSNAKYSATGILWKVKQFNPDVIIILMSGYPERDCRKQIDFKKLGVRHFWQKPFGVKEIKETFDEIFRDDELEEFLALAGTRKEES